MIGWAVTYCAAIGLVVRKRREFGVIKAIVQLVA